MDAIYTFRNYSDDSRPRLQFPARTGRQTTYAQWLDYQFQLNHDESPPPPEPDRPLAPTIVNHGRWLWLCPACLTAVQVSETDGAVDLCCCPACFNQGFVQPTFPDNRAAIEAELYRQPGYRWNAPFRNWEPGWSLEYLQERTARAQEQLAAGVQHVRAASIGTPRTWSVGEILTAANMNTYIREIQRDLIGTNGPVEFRNALVPGSLTTAERNALSSPPNGSMIYNESLGRFDFRESGNWGTSTKIHESQLFAGSVDVTVAHNLGVIPKIFQVVFERVKNTEWQGFSLGDRLVSEHSTDQGNPNFGVWAITTSSYTARLSHFSRRTYIPSNPPTNRIQTIDIDNDPDASSNGDGWGARVITLG